MSNLNNPHSTTMMHNVPLYTSTPAHLLDASIKWQREYERSIAASAPNASAMTNDCERLARVAEKIEQAEQARGLGDMKKFVDLARDVMAMTRIDAAMCKVRVERAIKRANAVSPCPAVATSEDADIARPMSIAQLEAVA